MNKELPVITCLKAGNIFILDKLLENAESIDDENLFDYVKDERTRALIQKYVEYHKEADRIDRLIQTALPGVSAEEFGPYTNVVDIYNTLTTCDLHFYNFYVKWTRKYNKSKLYIMFLMEERFNIALQILGIKDYKSINYPHEMTQDMKDKIFVSEKDKQACDIFGMIFSLFRVFFKK